MEGRINLITLAEVTGIHENDGLKGLAIIKNEKKLLLDADHFISLFGMLPNLDPIGN